MEIRFFKSGDTPYVRKICADTAKGRFAKNPKMREAICNAYLDYYIDCEPQNVLVAEEDGKVLGYIVCCLDAQKYQAEYKKYIKKIRKNSFFLAMFARICMKVNKKLDIKYGGGIHINLDESAQGKGLGTKLLTAMGKHILSNGGRYMYLVTANRKTRGYGFYMHYGFEEAKIYPLGSLLLVCDLKTCKKFQENE